MAPRSRRARSTWVAVAIGAVSLALHAIVLTSAPGRLDAVGDASERAAPPVKVALIQPPAPAVVAPPPRPAPATTAAPTPARRAVAAAQSPAATAIRPPRPRGVATDAVRIATAPAAPIAADEFGAPMPVPVSAAGADALASSADGVDTASVDTAGAAAGDARVEPGAPPGPTAADSALPASPVDAAASTAPTDRMADADRPPLPPLPDSRSQRFRVYWGDFTEARSVARLEYRLTHDGDRYEIRTEGEAEGLISLVYAGTLSQVSSGRLGPDGLEPLQYREQRGKRAERGVAFDPDAQRLKPNGAGAPVPMLPGTQDRLSVFYQIGLMARADPARFVAGASQEVPVATMRDVRVERFSVVGDDVLMAPGGPIRALHLRRPPPAGSGDPGIDLWLGYDFDMLPVRLRVEDASRRVLDQVIERGG